MVSPGAGIGRRNSSPAIACPWGVTANTEAGAFSAFRNERRRRYGAPELPLESAFSRRRQTTAEECFASSAGLR